MNRGRSRVFVARPSVALTHHPLPPGDQSRIIFRAGPGRPSLSGNVLHIFSHRILWLLNHSLYPFLLENAVSCPFFFNDYLNPSLAHVGRAFGAMQLTLRCFPPFGFPPPGAILRRRCYPEKSPPPLPPFPRLAPLLGRPNWGFFLPGSVFFSSLFMRIHIF